MQNNTQPSWEEELKYKLPQIILTALEYRGFYDCGKYLDDTIWESIEPLIHTLLSKQAEKISEAVEGLKTYTGGSSVNEKDRRINKADTLLAIKQVINK